MHLCMLLGMAVIIHVCDRAMKRSGSDSGAKRQSTSTL